MSAFAVTLDRLLRQLDLVESETASSPHPLLSAHVERATIRLRRAYAALQDAGPRAPVTLLIRLKGRAQEVEQALVDSDNSPPNQARAQHAQELATQVVEQIEQHLAVASTASESGSGGGHSRTPSTSDLPRRVPSSSSKSTTAPDQPILPVKDAVQRRAQALSDCYTLARLVKSGVVPSGKPLSSLLRLGGSGDTAESKHRERNLEAQIKAQLRRAYFDSFRPLFRPGENGGQRAAAWTRLAQDLVEAVIPLIPPRMSADPALYPTSAAAAADRTTSMRAAVERDLFLTATASATVQAEEGEEEYLPKLERLVRVLQRLCAPARDPNVRAILDKVGGAAIHPAPGTTAPSGTSGDRSAAAPQSHSSDLLLPSTTSPSQSQSPSQSPSQSQSQSQSQQPDLVVDLVREILDLAEAMHADLDRFHTELKNQASSSNPTTLSEQELERVVEREAAMRERAVVIEWYGDQEENVRSATRRWCLDRSVGAAAGRSGLAVPESFASVAAADPTTLLDRMTGSREEFALALVETLFASQPVAVPSLEETPPPLPPVERNNLLPPPLVVLAPLLFELQNQLQALVILACLATIASSSSSSSTVSSPPPGAAADASALLERLWTILDMNITRRPVAEERTVPGLGGTSAAADDKEEEEDGTRLAHLADEILAHLTTAAASHGPPPTKLAADPNPDLQKRVRASVDRILRYEDPVWKLFSKRLEGAVKTALLGVIRSGDDNMTSPSSDQVQPQVPAQLRTGRSTSSSADVERRRGPPLPPLPRTGTKRRAAADHVAGIRPVKVRGFDKPAFLADKVSELVRDRLVGEVWVHVEEVWGTILGWAELCL